MHSQGFGYVAKENLKDTNINVLVQEMIKEFEWLKHCVEEMDVTNIRKQYSLLGMLNKGCRKNNTSVHNIGM